jgi:hypothetical protein
MKTRMHWTPSSLKEFETCPAKYRFSYLFEACDWKNLGYTLVPSKGSAAMDRGTEIHETCDLYLQGRVPEHGLHEAIGPAWRNLLFGLKTIGAVPEEQWEFDQDWQTPDPSHPLWMRMKMDAHYQPSKDTLHVIDYKTGKPYNANMEQVEVYAIGGFAKFDDVNTIVGELWYFDSDEPHEKTFHRKDVSKLARKWEQRADRLLSAVQYPPRPNRFCDWCPYNAKKGGPCTAAS